jgi:hypothetical protein
MAFVCPEGGSLLPNTVFIGQSQSHHIVIPPKGNLFFAAINITSVVVLHLVVFKLLYILDVKLKFVDIKIKKFRIKNLLVLCLFPDYTFSC